MAFSNVNMNQSQMASTFAAQSISTSIGAGENTSKAIQANNSSQANQHTQQVALNSQVQQSIFSGGGGAGGGGNTGNNSKRNRDPISIFAKWS